MRCPKYKIHHPNSKVIPNIYTIQNLVEALHLAREDGQSVTERQKYNRSTGQHSDRQIHSASTMHNGASNEIEEIKVCKKCPKVKLYCVPISDPIMFRPFLDAAKSPTFCAKCVSLSKQSIIGYIFF